MSSKNIFVLVYGVLLLVLVGCDSSEDREVKYLNKAQAYYDEGNYEKMEVELKNVLQINPKNIEARYLIALAAEKKQEWRRMFGALSSVVEAAPQRYEAQIKLGKLFLFNKEIEKATEKVEMVLAVQPKNVNALALKATILLIEKKTIEAKALLNQALETVPGHFDASLLLVKILDDENDLSGALSVVNKALEVDSSRLNLLTVKINILLAQGNKIDAEVMYKKLIEKYPENQGVYFNFVKFYTKEKRYEEGEKLLRVLMANLPAEDKPKLALIEYLIRLKGVETAEKEVDKLINEYPENFDYRFIKLTFYKEKPEKYQILLKGIVKDDRLGVSGIMARIKLAQLALTQKDTKTAGKLVDEVIELDAKNFGAHLIRAGIYLNDGDNDAAIADTRTILRDNPESEPALTILAVAHLKSGNIDLAGETIEKILIINPNNKKALKDLVKIKVRLEDDDSAINLLIKAKKLFKNDSDVSIMLIDLYGKQKEWLNAEVVAKEFIGFSESIEDKEKAHYKLAQVYIGQEKFEAGIKELITVLETTPLSRNAMVLLVSSYIALKQDDLAIKFLDEKLENNPNNIAVLNMRAELHNRDKQFSDSEKIFKKVIGMAPKVERAYDNLVFVHILQKQIDKALIVYQAGLKELPGNINFLTRMAYFYAELNFFDKATTTYLKILEIQPDNLLALNNLAAKYIESSDSNKVKEALVLVSSLKDSEYAAFLDTYGWVNFKNGNSQEALIALETVVKKEQVIPEMHYHLGMVYSQFGRVEEAKRQLEKALLEKNDRAWVGVAREEMDKLIAL